MARFGRVGKAVQVEMISNQAAVRRRSVYGVRFDQRISRAAHAARVAERMQRGAHQRGLARAEIAAEMDLQATKRLRGARLSRLSIRH